ncbi:MAG: PrsW family glutamic-type intramembrane protease [Methanoregula sp.]|nr:PrsW family glutamic-type intramembrane protease [Methanoregula sp.]
MAIDLVMGSILVAAYFIPLFFLMAFIRRAGKKYIIYLFWGFLSSVPVLILVSFIPGAVSTSPYFIINVSPLLEEFFKALPIIIPALICIKNKDEDLLVCAMASGIGFSIIENLIFFNPELLPFTLGNGMVVLGSIFSNPPVPGEIMSVFIRSFSTSLMHGCTCGIIGYGIVLIRNFDRHALVPLLFGFYTIAVTTHAFFNLLSENYGTVGIILDLIIPVVLFFFLHACYHVDVPILFKKNPAL